jgi:hypothetical protein
LLERGLPEDALDAFDNAQPLGMRSSELFEEKARPLEETGEYDRAEELADEGPDLADAGGQSTRPGVPPVEADEEWVRFGPALAQPGRRPVPALADTTQSGNPVAPKFIPYTYYAPFHWVLAPNVYYYELQQTAVADAKNRMASSFERNLETQTMTVAGSESPVFESITFVDADGREVVRADREDGRIVTEQDGGDSRADETWFSEARLIGPGETYFGDVRSVDGHERVAIATPVYSEGDGTLRGVVAAEFNYSLITATTNSVTVGDSGHVAHFAF